MKAALAEARWQGVLNSSQDAIVSIDSEGRIVLFNRAAQDMFGWAAEEVMGQNVTVLMPPPYRDEHDQYLKKYHETGVPGAIGRIRRVEAQRRSGEIFPIELSVSEARAGSTVLYTAIVRDVTERVRTQDRLRDSEAKMRAIVDAAADAIITIDESGFIESFNRAAERLFGYAVTEVLGENVRILMPLPYQDEHDRHLERYLRSGIPRIIGFGREAIGRRKDGATFPIHLAVSEVQLKGRRVFTGIIRDLTDYGRTAERFATRGEVTHRAEPATLAPKAHEILSMLNRIDVLLRELISDALADTEADSGGPAAS